MRIKITEPLFAWDCLDDAPTLKAIGQFLQAIPDAKLLEGLRQWRGRGRNEYPVGVLWGVLLLTIVLRHPSIEATLAELRRNPALRRLIGIDMESQVPKKWNMSRFLDVLGQQPHQSNLRDVFDRMIVRLAQTVATLGQHTAGDASGLNARRRRQNADESKSRSDQDQKQLFRDKKKTSTKHTPPDTDKVTYDEHGLPQPAGGRKEYTDDEGTVVKVVQWFGYKFHLLVDVKHEVVLAYQISSTKEGDNQLLPKLLEQAQGNLPSGRIETLAYDKAADDGKVHKLLHDARIKPLIQNRSLWDKQQDQERVLPDRGVGNIVYDEAGTVYCYDQVSDPPVRQPMAFIGHEQARGTLKYRCPARHEGWSCPSDKRCNAGKTYGLTVRVKQEIDLRRFPPIPRATKQFKRLYKGRTAVERVNARIKVFWGADDGNISRPTRFHGFLGAIMVVHAGLATLLAMAPRREGTLGKMRLSPIAKQLQKKLTG